MDKLNVQLKIFANISNTPANKQTFIQRNILPIDS